MLQELTWKQSDAPQFKLYSRPMRIGDLSSDVHYILEETYQDLNQVSEWMEIMASSIRRQNEYYFQVITTMEQPDQVIGVQVYCQSESLPIKVFCHPIWQSTVELMSGSIGS